MCTACVSVFVTCDPADADTKRKVIDKTNNLCVGACDDNDSISSGDSFLFRYPRAGRITFVVEFIPENVDNAAKMFSARDGENYESRDMTNFGK